MVFSPKTGGMISRSKNDKIKILSNGFIRKKKNGKYGLLNAQGELVLDYNYDKIFYKPKKFAGLPEQYIVITKNDTHGVADTTGTIIIPPIYDKWFEFKTARNLFITSKEGEKVILNKSGEAVLPERAYDITVLWLYLTDRDKFPKVTDPNIGVIIFKINNQIGFYNPLTHKTHITKYSDAEGIRKSLYLEVTKNGSKGLIDLTGNIIIPVKFDHINFYFPKGHIIAEVFTKNGQRGYFNVERGKFIVTPKYDRTMLQTVEDSITIATFKKGELMGMTTLNGQVRVPAVYNDITSINGIHFLLAKKKTDDILYSIYNRRTDKIYSLPKNKGVRIASDNLLILITAEDVEKLYNVGKRAILQGEYGQNGFPSTIRPFKEHLAKAKKNGKWGFINTQGDVVVPFTYLRVSQFRHGVAKVVQWQSDINKITYGFIDSTGSIIVPVKYETEDVRLLPDFFLGNDYLALYKFNKKKKKDLIGYATWQGKVIIPPIYDSIYLSYSENYFLVKKNQKFGVLDTSGGMIVPTVCDEVKLKKPLHYYNMSNVYFGFPLMCRKGDKWVYFDKNGNQLPIVVKNNIPFYRNER